MLGYFPVPYQDETLYSVVARFNRVACLSTTRLLKLLFGECRRPIEALEPKRFLHLENQLPPGYPLSAIQILENHTSYRLMAIFRKGTTQGEGKLPRINWIRINEPRLQYCSLCRQEDMENHGETYWRRAHQIIQTAICHRHSTALIKTNFAPEIRTSTKHNYRRTTLTTANEARAGETIEYESDMAPEMTSHRYAWLGHKILNTPLSEMPSRDEIKTLYKIGLQKRGIYAQRRTAWYLNIPSLHELAQTSEYRSILLGTKPSKESVREHLQGIVEMKIKNPSVHLAFAVALDVDITQFPKENSETGIPHPQTYQL